MYVTILTFFANSSKIDFEIEWIVITDNSIDPLAFKSV